MRRIGKSDRGAPLEESGIEADGYRASRLFPQSRRLSVGMSGPHARSRIHPADRGRPLRRRLPGQLEIERLPRHPRPHLRSSVRARVPPRPRRGGFAGHRNADAKPEPVAICRLKRVAADYKEDIRDRACRSRAKTRNGKRIALVGAGPGVADRRARSRAARLRMRRVRRRPAGRRHDAHADSEIPPAGSRDRRGGRLHPRPGHRISRRRSASTLAQLLGRGLGTPSSSAAARRAGATSTSPDARKPRRTSTSASTGCRRCRSAIRRRSASASSCSAAATRRWTAAAASRRLGGEDVQVVVRSGFDEMKASPWEKEDAMHEGIPIHNYPRAARRSRTTRGRLTGVTFEKVAPQQDAQAAAASSCRPASPTCTSPATTCLVADRARRTRFRGSSATSASRSTSGACRSSTARRWRRRVPGVFFGGDAAFGPKNIIWAVAHGHDAAISIDLHCRSEPLTQAPAAAREPGVAEDGHPRVELRQRDPRRQALSRAAQGHRDRAAGHPHRGRARLRSASSRYAEAQRCLNCDVQTVFADKLCIECDACVDICPMDCITFTAERRRGRPAHAAECAGAATSTQDLYVSGRPEDRPRDGEGRGHVPALRAVRRALPDRRMGHAEVPARHGAGGRSRARARAADPAAIGPLTRPSAQAAD